MPDLLREQFPHFRPIVEAFGYRNLEFEGWEADDVIATLATRADAAGIKTCVVSTDRDAFQLCSENVCLMMTPRGVADVHVYTPERVEARATAIRPDQVPDFIGLKGDTSDNIPGVPGIGDKTAGQLIAQYGSLEAVIEHVGRALARAGEEHHRARRPGARVEGARDDAPRPRHRLRPGRARARPPDRSQLKEMFRRFEFRGLLAPRRHARRGAAGRGAARGRGRRGRRGARATLPRRDGPRRLRRRRRPRRASRPTSGVVVGRDPSDVRRRRRELVAHDAKALRRRRGRRHAARGVPDRAGPRRRTSSTTSPPSTASSSSPEPAADEETAALVRRAEAPRAARRADARAARRARRTSALPRRSSCR